MDFPLPYTYDNLVFSIFNCLMQGMPLTNYIELGDRTPTDIFNDLGIDILAVIERVV